MNLKNFLTVGIASVVISSSFNAQARENHKLLDELNPQKPEVVQETKDIKQPDLDAEKINANSRTHSLIRVGAGLLSIASGKPAPIEISDITNIFRSSKAETPKLDEVKKDLPEEKAYEIKDNSAAVLAKFRNDSVTNTSSLKP